MQSRSVTGALVFGSLASMGIGLAWFSIPKVYLIASGPGYMVEYPNWRGYPFMTLAIIAPILGTALMRRGRLGASQLASSSGLLTMGLFCAVVGIALFFTPDVEVNGDMVMIGYPNFAGVPWIIGAAVLWILAWAVLRPLYLGRSSLSAVFGFLVAGLVAVVVSDLLLGISYVALTNAGVIPSGSIFVEPYARTPPVALWLAAGLFLWPLLREEWRGASATIGVPRRNGNLTGLRRPRRPRGR